MTASRRWVTLGICCSALFMVTLDNTVVNVALPSLQRELHPGEAGLQWVVDAYILSRGVFLFSGGAYGDRFGRRTFFRLGLCIFTAASLACSVAPNSLVLIVFRCVQGAGGAMMTPSSLAIVSNVFTNSRERAQALGIWSASTGLSTAAGPVFGGLLVQAVGWRGVFWINIPIGVAVLVATRFIPESRAEQPRAMDAAGQLAMIVCLGSLIYALIDAPDAGWGSPTVLGLLVLSVAATAFFIAVERRNPQPMLPLHIFRNPSLVGAVCIAVNAFLSLGAFVFFNSLYLQDVRGLSPLQAGLLTVPTTVATLVLAPISGRLTGTRGTRLPATLACALISLGMAFQAAVISPATNLWLLLLGYMILGCGTGLVNAPATNAAVSSLPRSQSGVAGATTSTARQIGTSLGVALIGSIIFSISRTPLQGAGEHVSAAVAAGYTDGLRAGYGLAAVVALGCTVLSLLVFRHERRDPAPI